MKVVGLLFVATTRTNISPSLVLELLHRIARVIKDYLGVLNEDSLRKNFVLVYELLDEVIVSIFYNPIYFQECWYSISYLELFLYTCFNKNISFWFYFSIDENETLLAWKGNKKVYIYRKRESGALICMYRTWSHPIKVLVSRSLLTDVRNAVHFISGIFLNLLMLSKHSLLF